MEVKREEGFNSVQHITVRYEIQQNSAVEADFDISIVKDESVENPEHLAIEKSKNLQDGMNEDPLLVLSIDGRENSKVNDEIITTDLNLDNPKVFPVDREHSLTVLEVGSGGKSRGSVPAPDTVTKQATSVEFIEINDSSEEETQSSVVSSECVQDHPGLVPTQPKVFTVLGPACYAIQNKQTIRAFETAIDDWYLKLAAHGPLKDCEIMESARQLAQRFNLKFSNDEQWLSVFKSRQLLNAKSTQKRDAKKRQCQPYKRDGSIEKSVCKEEKTLAGTSQDDSVESSRKRGRKYADLSHDGYFLLPSKNISETPDYPLLLRRAQNADPSGRPDDGELFVTEGLYNKRGHKPKENPARFLTPVENLDDASPEEYATPLLENGETSQKAMKRLEASILKWYLSLTSQHKTMVAPCIFESKAVDIAQSLKMVNFHPSKTWMEQFIRRHGIWCTLNQTRTLFLEPKAGLLKHRFDVEFESWYHVFPDPPDSIIDYYLASKKLDFRLRMKNYLTAIFNWYSKQSSVSANDILAAESQRAEPLGLSESDIESVRELYRDWCVRHKQFNESVREGYNVGLPIMLPSILKKVSLRWAFSFNFNGFTPSQFWMRRYLQLNGLFYKEDGLVKWYRLDATSCGHEIFDNIFRVWETASTKNYEWLKNILDQKFRENVENPLKRTAKLPEEPDTPLQIVQTFTLWTGAQSARL